MSTIVWAVAALTLGASPACPSDFFPLKVGNWWQFECTNVVQPDEYVHDAICVTSEAGTAAYKELSVSAMVSVDTAAVSRGAWIEAADLASYSASAILYYILEGTLVPWFVPAWSIRTDAVLVRRITSSDGVFLGSLHALETYDPDGMVVQAGVRSAATGQWLLYPADLILWHPDWSPEGAAIPFMEARTPNDGWTVADGLLVSYAIEHSGGFEPSSNDPIAPMDTKAGSFTDLRAAMLSKDFDFMIPSLHCRLYFARDVGLVRMGLPGRGFEIVSASMLGSRPTAVKSTNWGAVKVDGCSSDPRGLASP